MHIVKKKLLMGGPQGIALIFLRGSLVVWDVMEGQTNLPVSSAPKK